MTISKNEEKAKAQARPKGGGFIKVSLIDMYEPMPIAARRVRARQQELLDSMLIDACRNGEFKKVKRLLERGANPNAKDKEHKTALMWAVYEENLEIATLLILHGANVNLKDKYGQTALMVAAELRNVKIAELLLRNNAKVNEKSSYGWTALTWAKENEDNEMIQLLFMHGAV
ncbi:MAG: ankyrin repeat domain-containing protein [Candidatus Micrarchaeia archaeon]